MNCPSAQITAQEPGTRLIVGARGSGRAVPAGSEVLSLDLLSPDSARDLLWRESATMVGLPT